MEPLLQANNLCLFYGKFQALAPTDLALHAGEITILTGLNGAGKSTLLLCLSGLLRPSDGKISLEGFDLYQEEVEAKRRLAFVPDVPRFYTELTAWEHLYFISLAFGVNAEFEKTAGDLMRTFGLWEVKDLYPHNYSRGMRLKLGILMALVRPFSVLLLDEPTSALDTESSQLLIESLEGIRRRGAAILMSTHNPSLLKDLADRTIHMHHGVLEQS